MAHPFSEVGASILFISFVLSKKVPAGGVVGRVGDCLHLGRVLGSFEAFWERFRGGAESEK